MRDILSGYFTKCKKVSGVPEKSGRDSPMYEMIGWHLVDFLNDIVHLGLPSDDLGL